jgi:hypothetical protein
MSVSITVNQYVIEEIKNAAFSKMITGVERGALLLNENHIKPNTPVDTGNLQQNNTYEVIPDEASKTVKVEFSNPVEYDPYVHDGTSKRAGRPYRDIGIHEGQDEFFGAIQDELKG